MKNLFRAIILLVILIILVLFEVILLFDDKLLTAMILAVIIQILLVIYLVRSKKRITDYLKGLETRIDDYVNGDSDEIGIDSAYPLRELKVLSATLNKAGETLRKQEEYKSEVFQSISHDFKTPLSVIKSHIYALSDGMITDKEFHSVVRFQIDKMESKVNTLLYLNKLNYITEAKTLKDSNVDIKLIIEASVKKFKFHRSELAFKIDIKDKTILRGNQDAWEIIIDNLLNNFMRYAEKKIEITIRNNQLILFNDGPCIDENVFSDIFSPYKKGTNGVVGLGLSIVKRTINMLDYEITVKNKKKGVSFIISIQGKNY